MQLRAPLPPGASGFILCLEPTKPAGHGMLGRNGRHLAQPSSLMVRAGTGGTQSQESPHLQIFEVCVLQLLGSVENLEQEEEKEEALGRPG